MVEAVDLDTVVFTHHSATTAIVKQISLSTSSTDKLNLRLVRASQYLSQFQLDVRYRPGKQHIVPDALSRLLNSMADLRDRESDGTLDEVFAFNMTLVEMSDSFKKTLSKAYREDNQWKKVAEIPAPTTRVHREIHQKEYNSTSATA